MVHPLFLPIALFATTRSRTFGSRSFCSSSMMSSSSTSGSKLRALPSLLDVDGTPLTPESLDEKFRNKRVAYYFAAGWCPMCTSFEPALLQFQEASNQSGKPVQFIYVGSDRSEDQQSKRAQSLQMMSVPFDQTAELKQSLKVWAGSESMKFGFGRRSGVPAIVVLDHEGKELAFVAAESQGIKALQAWPMDDDEGVWK